METSLILKKLETMLTPKRFAHSVGASETAERLAKKYGADSEKAKIAGLVHDCAKNIPKEEMVEMCERLGVVLDEETKNQLSLVHADLGAKLCQTEFGITDPEIISAVKYHTLGKPGMTLVEKIVFLSDAIEPTRTDHVGLTELRELAEIDLDEAVVYSANLTIDFVQGKGCSLHSQTYKTRDYYENLVKERKVV